MEGRVDEFLDLYKQLEEALEDKYRGDKRRYSSVVMEFFRDDDSAPVRDKLETCREIRNILTHSSNLGGEPVVVPSAAVVENLREVLEFAKRPPLALEYATTGDQMMKANLNQKVLRLMDIMEKNGWSHIPVMKDGVFRGVFSAGTLFLYQLKNGGRALRPETTLKDMERYLEVGEHLGKYAFIPRDATYTEARGIFEKVRGKNKRVSVVFITEHGRPGERLLGMLTPWDVLGETKSEA